MGEELLINITPMETRVARVENGMLQEVHIERSRARGIVGNIYLGRVVRVLPGMQAAFVEVGLERTGFLHASDIERLDHRGLARPTDGDSRHNGEPADIRELLREGQSLVVQVTKDPIGSKGARLTTRLSISSRFLVYLPHTRHIGISQRIDDEEERQRLRERVEHCRDAEEPAVPGGFIVRTVAEGADEAALVADMRYLRRLWTRLCQRLGSERPPALIYADLPLYLRTMRDLVRDDLERVRVDSRECHQKVVEFARTYIPELETRIEHYVGERPIFDLYGVEDELQRALGRKVELKSGGHLIIDQTEALTTVDVNTGAFVGRRNLEETIFKTNLEATTALARQLRIRNLGGMIIIDFIDMQDPEHQRQVLRSLERAMQSDYARSTLTGVSELGLVEMTRKRTRESLEHIVCEPCPVCQGRGSIKSAETVCYEIFREILREARAYDNDALMVLATQEVVDRLLDEESAAVADLEEFIGKTIAFQVESAYHREQFDVILL